MASPSVILKTNDVISRVPEFTGLPIGIAIPAKRGPVGVPVLCSGEGDILKRFTERGRIEIGYDLAYFSAIIAAKKSESIYVVRPDNGSEYGGVVAVTSAASGVMAGVSTSVNLLDPDAFTFTTNEAFLIHGSDPGVWNNGLSISLIDNNDREPGSFYIDVWQYGSRVERNLVSRNQSARDGTGRNIYIEDALQASEYIRAVDNTVIASTVALKFNPTTQIAMTNGDDGDPVTDSMMVTAIQPFRNAESYKIRLLIDGGRASVAYQSELDAIAVERNDAVAILSVPYAAEAASDYMTAIKNYVNTTLNLNSSASAIYSSHVLILDRFNDRRIYVAPDGFAAGIICQTAQNFEVFYAPAGDFAVVDGLDVRRRYTKAERDVLYDNRINPLRWVEGKRIRLWGQKTLLNRESYLTRLNVKLLMTKIEPEIIDLLDGFVFQFNDESTRAVIKARLDTYMDNIKARRGVTWFEVVCDISNNPKAIRDQNIIAVQVNAEPNEVGETIIFTRQLTSSGEVTSVINRS